LFVRFCEASKLDIDPAEVDMLGPPWPDLKADVFGHSHYFELAEVVQQDWMKAQAQQEKKPIIDSPLPSTAVWSPLESIIQKKATKKYAHQATPLSLLLYSGSVNQRAGKSVQFGSPRWTRTFPGEGDGSAH
jgi:hypothetical protein